jgi:eukaryotic-like serine/threonine-protein kinase
MLCLVREGAASRIRTPEPPAPQPNRLGDYDILNELGRGGMGRVYRAVQTRLGRIVALKVISAREIGIPNLVDRFGIEAEAAARLDHPNIVPIYETGEQDGWNFFSMRLVEGPTLSQALAVGPLPFERAARLLATVARAIHHAHERGVLHRDLKPGNILLDAAGEPHVTDFGLAKFTHGENTLTLTHMALGTPAYMSPEQAAGRVKEVTTASDVYGLGAILFELLTGKAPFEGESAMAIARQVVDEEPPLPGSINRKAPRDLTIICLKCLEKEPTRRYPTAAALADDLDRWLRHEPISAQAAAPAERLGKWIRRKPVHAALAVTGVIAIAALVAGTLVSLRQAARASRAQRETTLTLASMYTRSGLTAAANNDPAQAALWFANAAIIAADDPEVQEANLRRTMAWRREITAPVRALVTGHDFLERIFWNPRQPAMILWAARNSPSLVWDLASDKLWKPATNLVRAVWDTSGGRMAACDGKSAVVLVLAYPSGEELARLPSVGFAPSLAFSPDDRWLAVGSSEPFLWDWRTGERRKLPGPGEVTERFQFSQDGKLLILQTPNGVGICEVENVATFLHPPVANSILVRAEFLANQSRYLTGDGDGNIFIRDSRKGTVVENYPGTGATAGGGPSVPVVVSPDGRFIARNNAPLIDRSAGGPTGIPVHKNVYAAGAFSPDSASFASGSYDTTAKLWTLPGGEFDRPAGVHQHVVRQVAFSPDGTLLATDQYGLIRLWRVDRPPASRPVQTKEMSLAALSRDGSLLAPAGYANRSGALTRTRVVETARGEPVGAEIIPGGIIMDAAFSPDKSWLALTVSTTPDRVNVPLGSTPASGNLQLWNYRAGQRLGEPIPLPSEPRGLAIHPSGKWIGVVCQAGESVEIEVVTRNSKILFRNSSAIDAGAILANGLCAYSPDGRIFAAYASYQFFNLWDRELGRELIDPFRRDHNTFDLDFFGTNLARAVVTMSSHVELLDTRTGRPVAPSIPFSNWPMRVQFSPDGQLLLTAGGTRVGHVWDWRNGRLVCPALPHDDEIMGGAFIPGKPWVVTGGHDRMVKFWDYRTGMLAGPPLRYPGWVLQLKATPDGKTIAASGYFGGVIELLDLDALFPEPLLPPDEARLLAEIDAAAEVHPGGDLVPLTREAWLERWQTFRARHPDYPAHRLPQR